MENQNSQSNNQSLRQAGAQKPEQELYQQQLRPAEQQNWQQQTKIQQTVQGKVCAYCRHEVSDTADICENCGSWQLAGQCCFCYTPVEPQQKFCTECGNPPTGIVCSACGTHSLFDYCPNCHTSLTEQAAETLTFIQQSAEFQEVLQLHASVQALLEKGAGQAQIEAEQQKLNQRMEEWNSFYQQVQQQRQQQRPTRRNPAGGSGPGFNLEAAQANSQQLAAEQQCLAEQAAAAREQLLRAEAEQINRIAAMQKKMFADHQSARRYYGSLKLLIPTLVPKRKKVIRITGWLCVWANVLHPEGENGCGNPSLGGSWQYEIDEITDGFEINFNRQ
jgi:hypothetical protein